MCDGDFAAEAVKWLQPVLAPRGFPHDPRAATDESVLFHCDGADLDEVIDRYPGWRDRLRESYSSEQFPCLDVWVQRAEGRPSWSFESFERDVAAVAGSQAMRRLEDLETGPLEAWLEQLAHVLDTYFSALEAESNA